MVPTTISVRRDIVSQPLSPTNLLHPPDGRIRKIPTPVSLNNTIARY